MLPLCPAALHTKPQPSPSLSRFGNFGILTRLNRGHPRGPEQPGLQEGVPATGRCEGHLHPKPFCGAGLNRRGSLRRVPHFQLFPKAGLRGAFTALGTNSPLCAGRDGHHNSQGPMPCERSAQESLGLVLKKCNYTVKK